jgi:hypothetical protein
VDAELKNQPKAAGLRSNNPFEIIEDAFSSEKALFMKAYCDESGKHGAATIITICALLMSAKTCKELQRRWLKEAARSPTIPLPFHMSDCVVGSKLFRHLRDDEAARLEMQHRLIKTFKGLDTQAYGASVQTGAYKPLASQMRNNPHLRDPWFLAFEAAILELLDRSRESGKNHPIDLVFDRSEEFSKKALGLFDYIVTVKAAKVERLKGLSFVPKDDVAALQAADIVTYEVNRFFTEQEDAARLGVPHVPRPQFNEIRRRIPVNGRFWNEDALKELADLMVTGAHAGGAAGSNKNSKQPGSCRQPQRR